MIKKLQVLITIVSLFLLCGCAGTGDIRSFNSDRDMSRIEAMGTMSEIPAFPAGKRFTYLMAWNGIPVGRIVAEIGDDRKYRGYDVYPVVLSTESNKFLSKIYRVQDTYISYIDAAAMTSRRYEADRREGNYRKHVIVEYDFSAYRAVYTSLTDGSVKYCGITRDVQDPLSAMCYFMTVPVRLNDKVNITVNLNEKNYELYGRVESLDVVRLPGMGSFPAFRVRPYAVLNGERVKKGGGYIYFAAGDENRYPVYGAVWIPFGRVTATLRSVEDSRCLCPVCREELK